MRHRHYRIQAKIRFQSRHRKTFLFFENGENRRTTNATIPYWGSRIELMEVIAIVRDGYIHADTTEFPLEQAVDVYAKLKAGKILGRAGLVPA